MKKMAGKLCVFLTALLLLAACSHTPDAPKSPQPPEGASVQSALMNSAGPSIHPGADSAEPLLPDGVLASYYAGQGDPAFEYFQHSSIKRFLGMWVKEATGDISEPKWDYDSFTKISVLDHSFVESRPDEQLYYCTFSDGASRYGYAIVVYNESDPSLSNWSIQETTPYLYDLKANQERIAESLAKTDIDLSTAKAARVHLFDREKRRADQVIRFTDDKGDCYICYFGDDSFEVEKWRV